MRRLASSACLMALFSLLAAGCFQPTPTYVSDWQADARAHGAPGIGATLDLAADDYVVVGEGTLHDTPTPFTITPGMHSTRSGPVLFFQGTVLGAGSGLIVLEGEQIEITEGTLRDLPIRQVDAENGALAMRIRHDPAEAKPRLNETSDPDHLDSALFFADGAPIEATDLVIQTADRARLLMGGNSTDLTLPIRFDAHYLAFHPTGTLRTANATTTFASFGYAGTTHSGAITPHDRAAIPAPTTAFGRGADLRLTPTEVTSVGTFRLTQASTEGGYALEATVELRPERETTQVVTGNVTWAKVHYRESGYIGAGVLENITVTGDAAALVRIPVASPPWLIETLWEQVGEAGLGGALMAPWVAIATPWLLLGEALLTGLDCAFNDCPREHPYPVWMEPGEIGRFYYQVDATQAGPGTYDGTIVFRGANHETVELPVQIVVTED